MSEHFCLKWNNHQTTLVSVFDKLLECESLVDCTLAADGKFMKAHKVVLSACSPYLEDILRNHEDKHPILIFNDISFNELKAMLEYMYRGEVNVSQEQLNTFLKAAEALKIKGLTDQGGGGSNDGGGQENLKRKLNAAQNRKTHSPVMGMTPVERPSSPKRRKPVRRQSRDENFPGDSNSCDTAPTPPPSQPQQVNSVAARIEEKVAKIKKESCGAEPPPGGAAALSALGMLQPKTEFIEESGNVEDLTLEEEEEYGPNPGTSQGSFSSQDFNNWTMGDPTSDEVFMASQHDVNNSAGNSQGEQRKKSYKRTHGVFPCEKCGRTYVRKDSLQRHILWECGKDPAFQCPFCPQRCKRKSHHVRHIQRQHRDMLDLLQDNNRLTDDINKSMLIKNQTGNQTVTASSKTSANKATSVTANPSTNIPFPSSTFTSKT